MTEYDENLLSLLPADAPGLTVRELLTAFRGADPGPETENPWAYRSLRNHLYALRKDGKARLHGDARFPPLRWSK